MSSPRRARRRPTPVPPELPVDSTYRECCRQAIIEALLRDDRVFMMGEDIGAYGGCYAVSMGLLKEFGPERIRDTPLSESAFTGAGIGAALVGMRPIVEIMTVNFSLLALDQILNTAATIRHMSGGQFGVPLVIRMATGAGRQLAAQHSHSPGGVLRPYPRPARRGARHAGGRARDALDGAAGTGPGDHPGTCHALQHGRDRSPGTRAPWTSTAPRSGGRGATSR